MKKIIITSIIFGIGIGFSIFMIKNCIFYFMINGSKIFPLKLILNTLCMIFNTIILGLLLKSIYKNYSDNDIN